MTAHDILQLLRLKHNEDVFVHECKDGPTQSVRNHRRMDAWVMPRSWSRPETTAYEIKISRSDFIQDDKWRSYLPLCHRFYFVAPKNLIAANEVPPEAGLIEVLGTSRLVTQKKSPFRNVVLPENLWRYVLMCRSRIKEEWTDNSADKSLRWKEWVQERVEDRKLGYEVSKAIRETVEKIKKRNEFLEEQNKSFEQIKRLLFTLGINPEKWLSEWDVERKLKKSRAVVSEELHLSLKRIRDDTETALKEIAKLENEAPRPLESH